MAQVTPTGPAMRYARRMRDLRLGVGDALALVLAIAACGGGGGTPDGGDLPQADAAIDAGTGCGRTPRAADRDRAVVVSLPYDAGGGQASTYGVLTLGSDGSLTDTGTRFELGRSTVGEIAFTPDGDVGLVAQTDGTLGVFRLPDGGAPVVVDAGFQGSFYADRVVMDPGGDVAYVIDPDWRENGGGIYRVGIGCDGTLTDLGLWLPAKSPAGLLRDGDRLIVPAADVATSTPGAGDDVHLLDAAADPPAYVGGADAFGDDDAIVSGSALTLDGAYALVGDSSQFSGVPNRIAVVAVGDGGLTPVQVLTPVSDPLAILPSPAGDTLLVVSGFGDAVFVVDRGTGAQPFSVRGEPTYVGASPQLPGAAVMIERGTLDGLVLIGENQGVRRMQLATGGVTDLGLTALGSGTDAITGALGVQP
jgi:hypothetical protein